MSSTYSSFRPPPPQYTPVSTSLVDADALAKDAADTRRDTGATMQHIAIVGMIGSLLSSGTAFFLLTGQYWAISEGVMIAATVDYALWRWMRVSARLRKIGAESTSGKVLDWTVALMTVYLNGSAGLAPLIPAHTPASYGMLTFAHLFIPIVMLITFIALPHAQLLLQGQEEKAREEIARQQRADADTRRAAIEADQRARDNVTISENNREAAKANERTKQRDIEDAQNVRNSEIRREEIALDTRRLVGLIALCSVWSMRLDNAQAIMVKAERRVRDRQRRQPVDRSRRQVTDRSPTSPVDRSRRQAQPATDAAKTVTVDELVALATGDLSTARGMGRDRLRAWLSERAGGAPVSGHKAMQVMKAIAPEDEGGNVVDFLGRAAGGHR